VNPAYDLEGTEYQPDGSLKQGMPGSASFLSMEKVAVIVLGTLINALRHLVQGGVPSLISLANLKDGGVGNFGEAHGY